MEMDIFLIINDFILKYNASFKQINTLSTKHLLWFRDISQI